jgi:hypothetical protein
MTSRGAVYYAVHHDHLGGITSVLECLPMELLEHRCDAPPALVVSDGKSGHSELYCLDLIDELFVDMIPYMGRILVRWSKQGGVILCLDLGLAAPLQNLLTKAHEQHMSISLDAS